MATQIVPRATTSKKYPEFIRNSKTLAKFSKKQKTIFPRIGLKNCKEKFDGETIVFSSEGNEGLWDKATMSMRGIDSCQAWNGSYKRRLVGTMLDPYAGIIYTSTGRNTKKGLGMKSRAVVRFVISHDGKPAILLEHVYTRYGLRAMDYGEARGRFERFIREKTGGKYPVVYSGGYYAVPLTTAVSSIREDTRSYRDSGVPYKKIKGFTSPARAKLP